MNRDVLSATKKNMICCLTAIKSLWGFPAERIRCVLHALVSLRDSLSLEVEAVHVNHGIRGEEALRDEKFCSDFCKNLGIKLTVFRFDIPLECKKDGRERRGVRQAKKV